MLLFHETLNTMKNSPKVYITEVTNNGVELEEYTYYINASPVEAFNFFISNYIETNKAQTLHSLYIGFFGGNTFLPAFIRIEDGLVKSRLLAML